MCRDKKAAKGYHTLDVDWERPDAGSQRRERGQDGTTSIIAPVQGIGSEEARDAKIAWETR